MTANIARDVREGLQLSRNILVVTVGAGASANSMMLKVAEGLKAAGIDFYIPSADTKNLPAGKNPNRFWLDGAVTITTIHRAKGNGADVVYVVDLNLPDGQGLELLTRALELAAGVPVVVMSGHENPRLAAQALQLGARGYVIKDLEAAEHLHYIVAQLI